MPARNPQIAGAANHLQHATESVLWGVIRLASGTPKIAQPLFEPTTVFAPAVFIFPDMRRATLRSAYAVFQRM